METKHRNVLRNNRMKLAHAIETELFIKALSAANILCVNDVETIKVTPLQYRNEKLLDILPRRGPGAFDAFLKVLQSIDKAHLLGEEFELKATEQIKISKMNEEKPGVKNGGGGGSGGEEEDNAYDCKDVPPPPRLSSADNDMYEEFYDTVDSHDTPGPGHDLDEVPVDIRKKKDIEEEESYDMVNTPHPPPPAPVKEKEPVADQPAKRAALMINTDSTDFPANDSTDGPPSAASQVNESEDGPFGRIGASRPKATSPPADIVESASSASTPSLFTNHYQMKTNPRGHFLLINNKDFLPGSTMENYPRNGTDLDAAAMENLFEELGYIVSSHKNVTCFEMKRLVKKMANMNHSQYSAAACCFLSHGKEGVLYGTDGEIEIRDLTVYFGENKTLVGKPKMFFFQACQGSDYMDTIQRDGGMEVDGPGSSEESSISLPTEADFIYAYSTVPGFYSWRNSRDGSWFIQRFVEACRRYAHKMDLLRILTRVNQMVSENKSRTGVRISHNKRQIPSIVTQLRYELYLMPPNGPLKEMKYYR